MCNAFQILQSYLEFLFYVTIVVKRDIENILFVKNEIFQY